LRSKSLHGAENEKSDSWLVAESQRYGRCDHVPQVKPSASGGTVAL
jgi:hypothetical protein